MFWEQGEASGTMPSFNKMCVAQWRALNPDWHVRVLDTASALELSPSMRHLLEKRQQTPAARSDLLRLLLLAEHGGVWADASLLPLQPISSFVDQLTAPIGFFAFTFSEDFERPLSSWFLAATPGNRLVKAWRDAFVDAWAGPAQFEYYQVHAELCGLLSSDLEVSDLYYKMPRITNNWPHNCLWGCPGYWGGPREEMAPMLKRPFDFCSDEPPAAWMRGYERHMAAAGFMADTNGSARPLA